MSTLEQMKARVAAASKGPWELFSFTQNNRRIHSVCQAHGPDEIGRPYTEANAELITQAPEVHARLIAVMEFLDAAEKSGAGDDETVKALRTIVFD